MPIRPSDTATRYDAATVGLTRSTPPRVRRLQNGSTPLLVAVEERTIEWVRLLLERGANVNAPNTVRRTRADTSKRCGHAPRRRDSGTEALDTAALCGGHRTGRPHFISQ